MTPRSFTRLLLTFFSFLAAIEAQVSFSRADLPFDQSMMRDRFKTVDLNQDGKLDLIAVGNGQIVVQLGNGNGTFQPAKLTSLPVGDVSEFATGHINRDGYLDLVAASIDTSSPIFVCLGNGDGTFTISQTIQHTALITSLTAGDFTNNNTNALDIVVSDSQNRIAVYQGSLDGAFQPPVYTQLPGFATSLKNINLQRLGVPDLAFLMGGVASIWKNAGNGQFLPFATFSAGTGNFATDVVVADVNGDIQPDLIVPYQHGDSGAAGCGTTDSCSGLKIFYNSGTGSFVRYDAIYANTYTRISSPVVGDFNQDGVNDLAMFADRKSDDVLVLLSEGNGRFNAPRRVYNSPGALIGQGLTSGDFNGDGKIDIVTTSSPTGPGQDGAFAMLLNQTPDLVGCSRPDSPGVHICTPAAGIEKASPVRITAAGSNVFPTYSMLVWVDGTRRYNSISIRANTSQKVSPGYHRVAVESFFFGDVRGEKSVVYFTTPCPNTAGSTAIEGINICSPLAGTTVTSPVKVQAFAKVSSGAGVYRFELWVDGVKKVSVGSTGIMDTSVALPAGKHLFDFVLRRTDGSKTGKGIYVTVQ